MKTKDILILISIVSVLVLVLLFGIRYVSNLDKCYIQNVERNVTLGLDNPKFVINVERVDGLRCNEQVKVVSSSVCDKYGACANLTTLYSNKTAICFYQMKQEVCK
jgi:hypothetical protein